MNINTSIQDLRRFAAGLAIALLCAVASANAANTIFFSPSDPGIEKSVETWGVDGAWPNFDNVRQSFHHIGVDNVELYRVTFEPNHALVPKTGGGFELSATAKSLMDVHLANASLGAPNTPLSLVTGDLESIHSSYVSGGGINVANWVNLIKATQEYINSQPGFTTTSIAYIEPFNEPDFGTVQGTPNLLNSAMQQLKAFPEFQNTEMLGPSVLNSDLALSWYNQVPEATVGSSHLLAGSLTTWTDFIDHVHSTGKPFANPEIHSMGEMIAGAEHGMSMGMIWADVLRGRGTFIRASDGERLGYAEDLGNQSAGAVYRSPEGKIYAFAGGLERDYTGSPSSYRFVSTDQDVYFNGIPVREYMLQTKMDIIGDYERFGYWPHEGAFAIVETDPSEALPPLDGYRWKIQNVETGQFMEVATDSTSDGALIRSARNNPLSRQKWNIVRTPNGYYQLFNENSGRTAEVAGGSLADGASVRQWGTADNQTQQWYIEPSGDGAFYIRNGNSNKYLTSDPVNSQQFDLNGSDLQKWQFVLDNPTDGPIANYGFRGNVSDATGAHHGTAFGNPGYGIDPDGDPNSALQFDGVDDYVQLPSGVASSADITVAAWVHWDGGGDWQRIFDFGNDTDSYMFLTPKSGDNTMRFAITEASNGAEQMLETDPLPTDEWVHLAVTLGGNTGILYVNGEPQVAGQILLNPTDFNPVNNYIGQSQWPDPLFAGLIDDFRVYDYALDETQIADLVFDADYDNDGDVDGIDFLLIQQNDPSLIPKWQDAVSGNLGAVAAIPEPTALALGCSAILYSLIRRRC